jgi:hypothetical protein
VGDLDFDEGHVGDAPRLADGFARHRARLRRSGARRENSARAAFTPLTEKWRSLRIYCDGNGDEDVGFLKPMARFATWDRKRAIEARLPALDSVRVELGEFPFDSAEIEDRVVALQTEVDRAGIRSYGLGTRRNFGEFPSVADGYLFVDLVSGHQVVSRSAWISEAHRLNRAAEDLNKALHRHSTEVDRAHWLEAYDWSPREISERKGWEWNGSLP